MSLSNLQKAGANEAFPPQLQFPIIVILLPLSVLKTKHIYFIYTSLKYFYISKGIKENFISLHSSWWFQLCFPASKTHPTHPGLYMGWVLVRHCLGRQTPFSVLFHPQINCKLIISSWYLPACTWNLRRDSQGLKSHPFTHKNLPIDAEMYKQKTLNDLNYPLLAGIYTGLGSAKNHRNLQAKLVFLWSLCAAVLMGSLIFPKRAQLFSQISFITIYTS